MHRGFNFFNMFELKGYFGRPLLSIFLIAQVDNIAQQNMAIKFKTILYILSKQVGNTIYVRIFYCKLKIITEVQCVRIFEDHLVMKSRDKLSRDPLKKPSKSEQIYFEGMIAYFWSSNIWTRLTCLQQKRSRNLQICNVCSL